METTHYSFPVEIAYYSFPGLGHARIIKDGNKFQVWYGGCAIGRAVSRKDRAIAKLEKFVTQTATYECKDAQSRYNNLVTLERSLIRKGISSFEVCLKD